MDYGRHGVAISVSAFSGYCPNFHEQITYRFGAYFCVYEERYGGISGVYGHTLTEKCVACKFFGFFYLPGGVSPLRPQVRHKTGEIQSCLSLNTPNFFVRLVSNIYIR
jgi:hypothetical protein